MFLKRLLPDSLLLIAVCLLLTIAWVNSPALAYETWVGPYSFTSKGTVLIEDAKGNVKFSTYSLANIGRVELYVDENGPAYVGGYCMKFIDSSGVTRGRIKSLVLITTWTFKGKSEKIMAVGVGEYFDPEGDYIGDGYIEATGTIKKNAYGIPISITLTMKVSAGINNYYIFTGSPKVTLTPQ
ncbi:MAG: hypothetical protein FJ134_05950 [Deltaproteobacteria bacterium]|nr:hypothetical protein [Deltaproteobacteria bacterium]